MANIPIEESLSFDVSGALQGISQIDDALTQVVQSFQVGLASALETLTSAGADVPPLADTLDVAGLGPAVDTALTDALSAPQPPVSVEADTAPLTDAIDAATSVAPIIAVDADTTAAQDAIDALIPQAIVAPIEADTTAAQTSIDALTAQPVEIPVEADTSAAQSSINDLGDAASGASGKIGNLTQANNALEVATNLAGGDIASFSGGLGGIGAAGLEGAAGLVVFGGFLDKTINLAADAEAQNRRFQATFGALAEQVQHINVAGLIISLKDLGLQSGTSSTDLQAVASRIGALGQSSGAGAAQIVKTTDSLLALGATFSVNNPRLGDAATVTDQLTSAFARGGRALAPFGLAITATEINLRAERETGKTTATQLTLFEKATAGAEIATAQFGTTLGLKFAAGSQNAQVQLRALKTAFDETLTAIGQPLLQPAVNAFADFLPIVEKLGIVLGDVGHTAIPIFTALTPILGAVVAPLTLIGDGFVAIGDALAHVPPAALTAIAVGILAIGAATGALDGVIAAFLALDPVVLGLVAAVAAVGAIVDVFGHHEDSAAAAAKNFTSALFATGSSTDTLGSQLASLDTNLTKTLATVLDGIKVNSALRVALDSVGGGVDGLKSALTGTDAQFKQYAATVADATAKGDGFVNTLVVNALEAQRKGLQDTEAQQLANLFSTNQLTKAQLDQIDSTFHIGRANQDLVGALTAANVIVEKNAAAQAAANNTNALATDGYTKLAASIAAGTTTTQDAATVAMELGISTQDATTFIKDQIDALAGQKDAQLLASSAARDLRGELAAGTITTGQAETAFLQMGISLGGTKQAITDTTTAIDNFIAAASKGIPDSTTAITAFERGTTQAQTALDAALKKQTDTIASVDTADQAAYDKIAEAHDKGGKHVQAAVQTAIAGFDRVADAGKQKINAAGDSVIIATDKLSKAAVPQELIDTLKKNLTDIANFETNLAKIVKDGGVALAAEFAQQGPAIAGAQAAAFAFDPKGTKSAEALIARNENAKTQFIQYLTTTFGPDIGHALATQSGIQSKQFDLGQLAQQTQPALLHVAQSIDSSTAIRDATRRLAEGGAAAFNPDLATPAQAALLHAGGRIAADGSVQAATGAKGIAVGGAFQPPFADAAKLALTAAVPVIRNVGSLTTAAGLAGHAVGIGFDSGMAEGLAAGQGDVAAQAAIVAASAELAAKARLGIKSPSTVGVDIGSQFVLGIAQGMAALSPLHQATAALALALIPDLRPALKQIPSLAPGIVASSPLTGPTATSPVSDAGKVPTRRIESTITLNKTDPDPKHFADELAWSLQGV